MDVPLVSSRGKVVMVMTKLMSLPHAELFRDVNYTKIPVYAIAMTEEGMAEFNEIYQELRQMKLNKIIRTKSNGISTARLNFRPPMWDVRSLSSCVEITLLLVLGAWRIQFRNYEKKDNKQVWGRTAFKEFAKVCQEFDINLDDYAIDNGEEVKKEIESPKIELFATPRKIYRRVHHLDLNSSHIAGMVKYHPYLAQPFELIYTKRKENPVYKDVLTHTWGFLQSKLCQAKWAHISRDGIRYTNERIKELTELLTSSGREVLAWNTDGIWYAGEVYHDENEGLNIGQWKNDYTDCLMWRAKSKGAYEFIDQNGKYKPVIRGLTRLDKVMPRENWTWGDIFTEDAQVISFAFDEEKGIYTIE